ncbi:MAG: CBS and ACT domain-containing protein [Chloroflexota bacterium]
MLVGERMSQPVITITPDTPIHDALALFKKEHIRRAPVMKDGRMIGIVSERDLLNASPSPVSTLSVWEMNYLLSKVTVGNVMTKEVLTVARDTPIEEAARIMADNKLGGLPVVDGERVVGMITETNLFKIFLELMGAREQGVRATVQVEDKPGQLMKLTQAITDAGGNFISFGQFTGPDASSKLITFKVAGLELDAVKAAVEKIVRKFWDVRQG